MKRSENEKQKAKKEVLQTELLKQRNITNPLPDDGVNNERYSFTRVEGVTVCFGPNGGIILPSVRSFRGTALQAAVYADDEFKKNRADSHDGGHDGRIVGIDWRCDSTGCDCQREPDQKRFIRSVKKGRCS